MEEFNESQSAILEQFVTSTTNNVFALRNLPEVIKGALFSRYSRSSLGLRSLLLKEFILNDEAAVQSSAGSDNLVAVQKAQNFYDRILDGYGDDSIGELGGAHLALEDVSMLAAKIIEDCRIGGSPLEKSTRYIYFDQKANNEYLYYREPVLIASAYRDLYLKTCNHLFDVYSQLIPPLTARLEAANPYDPNTSKSAYTASLRAKVLDCLRGLLPTSAMTNVGVFGNGRFFESLVQKMHSHNLAEIQELGRKSYSELSKIIPSFVRRAEPNHRHYQGFAEYHATLNADLRRLAARCEPLRSPHTGVRLLYADPDAAVRVGAALLYPHSHATLEELQLYCSHLSEEDLIELFEQVTASRTNRRHKSPRALEQATFTFEIVADFGVYRDLQRHRMLSQERQFLTCNLGYFTPPEIVGTDLETPYREALETARRAFETIANAFPEEAQYIVPMAYNIRWFFHVNLRALQWLTELRSQPAGHPSYRIIAQEMARQVSSTIPVFERFFKFVDFSSHDLGRLGQEQRKEEKLSRTL